MKGNIIKLNESQLMQLIRESVQEVLFEADENARRREKYKSDEEYRNRAKERAKAYSQSNKEKVNAAHRAWNAKRRQETQLQNTLTDNFTSPEDITQRDNNVDWTPEMEAQTSYEGNSFEQEDKSQVVMAMLKKYLSKREIYIITKLFGLFGEEPMDMEELGDKLYMSRSGIRVAREAIIKKLGKAAYNDRKVYNFLIEYLG